MTNKQLYNLVFENYIQAKRELIREGYLKTEESKNIDFNEIFSRTKGAMQEKKIEKLQRENQMLKEKLSQKQIRKESIVSGQGGVGSSGGAGTQGFGNLMNRVGASVFKDKGSMAELAANELVNSKDSSGSSFFDRMMDIYPRTGKAGLISLFKIKMTSNLKNGMSKDEAKRKAMADMDDTLVENRRRRRY
jgi:hypothetical protein